MEKLKLGSTSVLDSQQHFTPLLSSHAFLFSWEIFFLLLEDDSSSLLVSIAILSVPLETAVGPNRSVGKADGWWEAGRVRDTEFSNLLEIVLVCILFWQHSWRQKRMCIHVFLPTFSITGRQAGLLLTVAWTISLWNMMGNMQQEAWWRRWLLRGNDFSLPSFFLTLSGLLSPWKIASSKASNFFKNVWRIHLPIWITCFLPFLEAVGNTPWLKFKREVCTFMWLPKHITFIHRS